MRRLDQRGETLVEVVMALGILSLVLVSSYALATGTFRVSRGAGERTQAVNYLQQQAEALRTFRDASVDWQAFRLRVAGYGGQNPGGTFCMVKTDNAGVKTWEPKTSTGEACLIDDKVTIAITAKDTDPTPPGGISQQYQFDIKATWTDSSGENNTSLQVTLTDQGKATP